ncbi:unnamed protein product [Thlaspi arvense]|uniref:Uncharacterized protein n=1 Tax=Thlaspi arvense TaxID=13288 RepID=A0AAU9RVT7_THLAR|nr:unnamed protein product [Thlaspi arvense]
MINTKDDKPISDDNDAASQDPKNVEQDERKPMGKSVPETQDNVADDSNNIHTSDVHLLTNHLTRVSANVLIGPSKRSNRKQSHVTSYEQINGHFKEMMELRSVQKAEAKERREKNEAQPYKEAYGILQSVQGLTKWTDFWWDCVKVLLKEDPYAREMMVYNESDDLITFLEGYTGYDHYGIYIGNRFKTLQSCNGDSSSVNLEQNIKNT